MSSGDLGMSESGREKDELHKPGHYADRPRIVSGENSTKPSTSLSSFCKYPTFSAHYSPKIAFDLVGSLAGQISDSSSSTTISVSASRFIHQPRQENGRQRTGFPIATEATYV